MELSKIWLYVFVTLTFSSELTAQSYDGSNQGHTTFPTDIPPNTKQLYLHDNHINNAPDDAFNEFYQLETLGISKNSFTDLPNLIPVGNTLKVLNLRYNHLAKLNMSIFNKLVVLEKMYISYNDISSFPDDAFNNLYQLETLDMEGNPLTKLPNLTPVYNTLSHLEMDYCDLVELNVSIFNKLVVLEEIDISDNDISSFPDDAFNEFYQLEILDIGDNPLIKPPNLAPVGNTLKVLEMDQCHLAELNMSMFNELVVLEMIDIGGNPFTELPNLTPIGKTLEFLKMKYCHLTELNMTVFNELVVLDGIDVSYCKLTSFPDSPGAGDTLRNIHCNSCNLITFPMLSNYKALMHVSFRDNPMTTVPEEAMATMTLTGKLHLEGTAITSLPDYPSAYVHITILDLGNTAVSFFLDRIGLNIATRALMIYLVMIGFRLGSQHGDLGHYPKVSTCSFYLPGPLHKMSSQSVYISLLCNGQISDWTVSLVIQIAIKN